MLTELTVENYRGFERYRLPELRRVNLLVGRNNCGKTSLLEAVRLFAAEGYPLEFSTIARGRGEITLAQEGPYSPDDKRSPEIVHFFHGHMLALGALLTIAADGGRALVAAIRPVEQVKEFDRQGSLFPTAEDTEYLGQDAVLEVAFWDHDEVVRKYVTAVTPEGAFVDPKWRGRSAHRLWDPSMRPGRRSRPALMWVSPEQLDSRTMSAMWDEVVQEGTESDVVRAMGLLEPRLRSIHFLSSERTFRHATSGVLLGFKGEKRRVPLGSQGDGMSRMLALSLSLSRTTGGYLLVDEIDTGLHWTVMADMWRLVIETARRNNTQVFATTHSLDCLRGLDQACRDNQHLAEDVSAHTIDPTLEESVFMTAKDIRIALEQDIEVR